VNCSEVRDGQIEIDVNKVSASNFEECTDNRISLFYERCFLRAMYRWVDFIVLWDIPRPRNVQMREFHCSMKDPSSAQCTDERISLFYERIPHPRNEQIINFIVLWEIPHSHNVQDFIVLWKDPSFSQCTDNRISLFYERSLVRAMYKWEDFIVLWDIPRPRNVHLRGFNCSMRDPSSAQCRDERISLFYKRSLIRAM
jgi:hypothetical protein